MAKLTYAEQLKHPNWQRKRLQTLEAAEWTCEACGAKEESLNVHHKRYVKGRMVWEYEKAELAVLCEQCHREHHSDQQLLQDVLMHAGTHDAAGMAAGLMAGYLDASCMLEPEVANRVKQIFPLYYELGITASCLELEGKQTWRDAVRRVVKSGLPMTPTLERLVDEWARQRDRKK